MSANDFNKFAYGLSATLGVLMVVAGIRAIFWSTSLPPDWLVGWTNWLFSALGVAFAPLAFVTTVQAVRKLTGLV
jgi:hypothetical protein